MITTTEHTPPPIADLQEAAARNHAARRIITGFTTAVPTLGEIWQQLETALADTPALAAEITRLAPNSPTPAWTGQTCSPQHAPPSPPTTTANPTPSSYLRDELQARGQLPDHRAPPMTSYRRMRRQARQIRRSGMQPMMVINSGDQLPETAGVLILRWAWRYRSELAPALRSPAPSSARSWWLHAATRTGGRSSSASLPWPQRRWPRSARGSASPR